MGSVEHITCYDYDTRKEVDKVMHYDNVWMREAGHDYAADFAGNYADYKMSSSVDDIGNTTLYFYDKGNPTVYRGKSLTWRNVNQMTNYGGNTYSYGVDGVRQRKNNKSYTYDGDKLLSEK